MTYTKMTVWHILSMKHLVLLRRHRLSYVNNHNNSNERNSSNFLHSIFYSAWELFFHADCSVYTEPCAVTQLILGCAMLYCPVTPLLAKAGCRLLGGCWVKGGGVGN